MKLIDSMGIVLGCEIRNIRKFFTKTNKGNILILLIIKKITKIPKKIINNAKKFVARLKKFSTFRFEFIR